MRGITSLQNTPWRSTEVCFFIQYAEVRLIKTIFISRVALVQIYLPLLKTFSEQLPQYWSSATVAVYSKRLCSCIYTKSSAPLIAIYKHFNHYCASIHPQSATNHIRFMILYMILYDRCRMCKQQVKVCVYGACTCSGVHGKTYWSLNRMSCNTSMCYTVSIITHYYTRLSLLLL